MNAIEVRGLRKAYGGTVAVDGLDLSVATGEIFALLGPNGAGKTTTVEILEGFRTRDAGTVSVLATDPATAGAAWRTRVGMVLQTSGEFDALTVAEVVRHFATYYPAPDDPDEVIERLGLSGKRNSRTHVLSGGQKRRLDVALGIVGRPELLFLDEPTTGFDPQARQDFWQVIRDLAAAGTTILLTTHYLHEAEALADRVGVLCRGRLLAVAPPAELGGRDSAAAVVTWQGPDGPCEAVTDRPTALVASLATEYGGEVPGLTVSRPTLEDVSTHDRRCGVTEVAVAGSPAATAAPRTRRFAGPVLGLRRGALEIKQFTRSRESVVFTLAFPVMLLLIFGSVFDQEVAPGVPFTQYFVAGMVAAGLLVVGFQNLAIMIPIERDRGALKRLRGTPMPPMAYFIGKVLMVLAIGVAETALLLALAFTLYDVPVPGPAGWVTFAWVAVLGITACTLCGIAFSSVVRSGRGAPAVVTPISLGLQFISGVFSLFTNLPQWMQQVAALFPLKWMAQGMRAVFLPASFASEEPAGSAELERVALVLLLWCVGALVACLLTFRWTSDS